MSALNAHALALLSAYVDECATAINPSLIPRNQRGAFDRLVGFDALKRSHRGLRLAVCPCCEEIPLQVGHDSVQRCPNCGPIHHSHNDLLRVEPKLDWLLKRLAQALTISRSVMPREILKNHAWFIGDTGYGSKLRRVIFARGLASPAVMKNLLLEMPKHAGTAAVIIVTTTDPSLMMPILRAEILYLPHAFRLHGGALIADAPILDGVLSTALTDHTASITEGPFIDDFRRVLLDGEKEPIPLTKLQGAIFRELWRLNGNRIDSEKLMKKCHGEGKPSDAFKPSKYPDANRAYKSLVKSERTKGEYWMPR